MPGGPDLEEQSLCLCSEKEKRQSLAAGPAGAHGQTATCPRPTANFRSPTSDKEGLTKRDGSVITSEHRRRSPGGRADHMAPPTAPTPSQGN